MNISDFLATDLPHRVHQRQSTLRAGLCGTALALLGVMPAQAQINLRIAVPGVGIGINLPAYPHMQRIPGHAVYYAPKTQANYFFVDGLFWVYENENWYSSSWYNGPWYPADAGFVPPSLLTVPVRYYRQPPAYFYGWKANAAPRWNERMTERWNQGHLQWRPQGKDSHHDDGKPYVITRAPLPVYQRGYVGRNYPDAKDQQELHRRNYRYEASGQDPERERNPGDSRSRSRNPPDRHEEVPRDPPADPSRNAHDRNGTGPR